MTVVALPDHKPDACSECHSWQQKFKALTVDFENAEIELRAKRRIIASLKSEAAKRMHEDPRMAAVEEVFAYWQQACNHPRARLGDARRTVILKALSIPYSVEELKIAIDGAAHDPFIDEKGKRFDDIELVLRNETKIESFQAREYLHQREKAKAPQAVANVLNNIHGNVHDKEMGWYLFPCPVCSCGARTVHITKGKEDRMFCSNCSATFPEIRDGLLGK